MAEPFDDDVDMRQSYSDDPNIGGSDMVRQSLEETAAELDSTLFEHGQQRVHQVSISTRSVAST